MMVLSLHYDVNLQCVNLEILWLPLWLLLNRKFSTVKTMFMRSFFPFSFKPNIRLWLLIIDNLLANIENALWQAVSIKNAWLLLINGLLFNHFSILSNESFNLNWLYWINKMDLNIECQVRLEKLLCSNFYAVRLKNPFPCNLLLRVPCQKTLAPMSS